MSPTAPAPAPAAPPKNGLFTSRLGSFVSVVPLTFWVINHLWDNLAAFSGAQAWEQKVTGHEHPIAMVLTYLFVFLPLLMHTGWGVARLFTARPNNARYNNYGNLKYLLQRLSALGALGFIGAHVWKAFLAPRLFNGAPEAFDDIAREMRFHGPTLVVYLLGTLGTTFHLANGIQAFGMAWGIFASERSMRRFEPYVIAIFLLLVGMSWGAIFALYNAGAAFGPLAD